MISSERMAAVDRNAGALGVPRRQLMESSGNAVARRVRDLAEPGSRVVMVCGRGNNGGDAFAAARFLDGYDVRVRLLGRPESITTGIARANWDALREAEYDAEAVADSAQFELGSDDGDGGHSDLVVDALLGTGVTGALREPEATAARAINASDATVLSVDVPSGVDADTGEAAGVAVEADEVVTFHDLKPGLADRDDVVVADIGIPAAAERFVGPGDLLGLGRDPASHKGHHGSVLVVGGGPYTGAPALSAQAALRAGADLAYVACPEPIVGTVQGYSEDLITRAFPGELFAPPHVDLALELAAEVDAVVLGPGLGDAEPTVEAVREFLRRFDGRAVVDADALGQVPAVETAADLVCTPHQGELLEMGGETSDDWETRAGLVAEFAADLGGTLLVKGAYDVVSDGERTRANRTGNPGMTVGGTGDVLAGVTAALLANRDPELEPFRAASVAAYVNGRAGDIVAAERGAGLVATDLLEALPEAMRVDDD